MNQVAHTLRRTLLFDDVHLSETAGAMALDLLRPFFDSALQKGHGAAVVSPKRSKGIYKKMGTGPKTARVHVGHTWESRD